MPRRIKTKSTVKKGNPASAAAKVPKKDLRFKLSLVVLIGLLAFSVLLLLFSLNKSVMVRAKMKAAPMPITKISSGLKKAQDKILNETALDFTVTVPAQIGEWFYKVGQVKSLTDDLLSDQYFQVFVMLPGAKSNNFNQQYKEILTIRKFSEEEWSDIEKDCLKEKQAVCGEAGELITTQSDADEDEWAYAFKKPADCPKSIEAKCALADKIIKSFQLK